MNGAPLVLGLAGLAALAGAAQRGSRAGGQPSVGDFVRFVRPFSIVESGDHEVYEVFSDGSMEIGAPSLPCLGRPSRTRRVQQYLVALKPTSDLDKLAARLSANEVGWAKLLVRRVEEGKDADLEDAARRSTHVRKLDACTREALLAYARQISEFTSPSGSRAGRIPKAAWVRRALSDYRAQEQSGRALREYDKALQGLQQIYNSLDEAGKEKLEQLDRRFHAGDTAPLVAYAKSLDPSLFHLESSSKKPIRPSMAFSPVEPVEDLSGLPRRLYHGSRLYHRLLIEGIRLPAAADILPNDTYVWDGRPGPDGWPVAWAPYVMDWFKGLSLEGRRSLSRQTLGRPIRGRADMGQAVSLLWTSRDPRLAAGYASKDSPVLEIDPRKLSVFGWFEPDLAGKDEVVLVLSTRVPQGLPNAVTAVLESKR